MKKRKDISLTQKEKQTAHNIELRSDEIRDILGQFPGWFVRWGTIFVIGILLLIAIILSLFKFSDIQYAEVTLTTGQPPSDLEAQISGRIVRLMVKDNDSVQKGQVLGVIETPVNLEDLLLLKKHLGQELQMDNLYLHIEQIKMLELGGIQEEYAGFYKELINYRNFIDFDKYQQQIKLLRKKLISYQPYLTKLNEQEKLANLELKLESRQFVRDSLLFIQELISESQYDASYAKKISKQNELKEVQSKRNIANIEITGIETEISELDLNFKEGLILRKEELQKKYDQLKGAVALWENRHLIRAPFDGIVSFTEYWSENLFIQEDDVVMTVLPFKQQEIIGKITLDTRGAGKVKKGQSVFIELDNYPSLEYGLISAKVTSISEVPYNNKYYAEVKLDSTGLVTMYGLHVEFRQNMKGHAEIITNSRRLLERLLSPLKRTIERQKQL